VDRPGAQADHVRGWPGAVDDPAGVRLRDPGPAAFGERRPDGGAHAGGQEQLGRLVMAVPPLCQSVALSLGTPGCRFAGDGGAAGRRRRADPPRPRGAGTPAATQPKRTSGACSGRRRPTRPGPCRCVRRWPSTCGRASLVRVRVRSCPRARAGASRRTPTSGRGQGGWRPPGGPGSRGTTIHDLRHTAASLLIAAGAYVKAVQVILGHSTATMTMDLHGHLSSEAAWQAMERLPVTPLGSGSPTVRRATLLPSPPQLHSGVEDGNVGGH
jgi:hypothetical protein